MKAIIYILLLCSVGGLQAQQTITIAEMQESLSDMTQYYESDQYYFEFDMYSYKGHNSNTSEDQSTGYLLKNREELTSYQLGLYTVQNDDIKIIVDSNERYVGLNYPDSKTILAIDEAQISKMQSYIEKITFTKTVKNRRTYQIDFIEGFTYDKLEIVVAPNGFMKEITLYFGEEITYEDNRGELQKEKAKVKMVYTEGKFSIARQKHTISSIIKIDKKDIHTLTPLFNGFELIEFRYKN